MKKKFFAVAAVSLAMVMGMSGCSGVADLFKGDDKSTEKEELTEEELLEYFASMEDRRNEILKDIDDLVVLGQYKGVEVTITATKVTDDQVQAKIDETLSTSGTVEQIKEGTVADGDTLNLDYVGKVDGVAFDGGTASGADLEIGSNQYIEGFEESLIGATIGSTVDINVTFPEDYDNEELNGKAAVFTVTINYKHGDKIPAELTDEWVAAQAITDVTTVDQYKEYVRSDLEETAAEEDEKAIYSAVIAKIIEDSEIKGLSADLNKEELMQNEMDYLEEYAQYYEMTVEDMIQQYMSMSLDEYKAQMETQIDEYFNNLMIYRAIIKAENIEVSQEDYEKEVFTYSPNYASYNAESEADFIEQNSESIYDGLLNEKAEAVFMDSAVVTRQ